MLAAFSLGTGTAAAAVGHSVVRTFSLGVQPQPKAVAIDGAGDVYVYLGATQRIVRFTATGVPLPFSAGAPYVKGNAITGTLAGPFGELGYQVGLAVDRSGGPNDGDIYLTGELAPRSAYVFAASGAYLGAMPAASSPCSAAVDQSTGVVYVGESITHHVHRFEVPAGNPEAATQTGELRLANNVSPCALAVDSTGAAFVGQARVQKFDASAFTAETATPIAEYQESGVALGVDALDDSLYFDRYQTIVKRDPTGAQQGEPFGNLTSSPAIAAAGDVFAADEYGGLFVFGPNQVDLPVATAGDASNVLQNSASVEGEVDPAGAGPITECRFRYGPDSGYSEGSVPCVPAASPAEPITAPTKVEAALTGLTPGTTYHYRVFVTNAEGTQVSRDGTFTTVAAIEEVNTEPATDVTKDSATLHGSYVGDGQDTHYYFEYGTDTEYGQTAPAPPGIDGGTAAGRQEVTPVGLTGLKGDTTYHFRLVATNSYGAARGYDQTFTTSEPVTDLTTEAPSAVTDTTATLHGSYTADSYDTSYYFEYGRTTGYGQTAPLPPGTDLGSGSGRVDVPAVTISGLLGGTLYHYRIVATNEDGRSVGGDLTFKTAEAPLIAELDARDVTATTAELHGAINPRFGQTTYHFEWGPTTAYGNVVPIPDGTLGPLDTNLPVSVPIAGLSPGVTYHFRLVARNQYGTSYSGDRTFSFSPAPCPNEQLRQETGSSSLPDCRAYELVSPSDAQGTTIFPGAAPRTSFATSPSRLAYTTAYGTFPEETGDPTNALADLFVSTRTATGWYQKYVGLPANQTLVVGGPPTNCISDLFQGQDPTKSQLTSQVSPDLSRAINYKIGDPSGRFGHTGEPSNAPYVWDTSTGASLGRWPTNLDQVPGGVGFIGVPQASADFSHFVFSSNVVFAPGGQPGGEDVEGFGCSASGKPPSASVYDNDTITGTVKLASVKADGTPFQGLVLHIAEDGSRILMAETADTTKGIDRPLFLRVDGSRTYEIAPGHEVHYVGSTEDGAIVYLTSDEQLTADDHDTSTDLFAWREGEPGTLTRISKGNEGNAGDTDSCEASWTTKCGVGIIEFGSGEFAYTNFASRDGGNGVTDTFIAGKSGDIYFESPELLDGQKGNPGQVNLYVFRGGAVHFVAALKPGPFCSFGGGGNEIQYCATGPIGRIQVTPDGDHMAMVTDSRLTGYDNAGHGEMYTFAPDAAQLECASCRTDGEPPVGQLFASFNGLFQTERGTVFFSTPDPLVPQDTDEVPDVYEYAEGRAQLISSGLSAPPPGGFQAIFGVQSHPGLIGVSANGTDVYFSTFDVLVSQDHNGETTKIYDARTGGGFPAEREATSCAAADECHGSTAGPPALPPDRTSAGFGKAHKKKHHKKKHHAKRHHKKKSHKKKNRAKGHKRGKHAGRGGGKRG